MQGPGVFLTDAQVEAAARKLLETMPEGAETLFAARGIDARDVVRFEAVAARCREARERLGLSIKSAAVELRVPQYRLKEIEQSRLETIDPRVLARWVARLDLGEWFARWCAHNAELAGRLTTGPDTPPSAGAVLRFRITLEEVEPAVWRRIEIPADASFWDLHVAIQDAMGWQDYHLHEFELPAVSHAEPLRIGIPDEEFPHERPTLPGWQKRVAEHFRRPGARAAYLYDFGDSWQHAVVFEGAGPREPGIGYPRCVAGARACPPEDVGGAPGYGDFLAALTDPEHEEHERMLEWSGGDFDPERFIADAVRFSDPHARWQLAFGKRRIRR